MLLDADALCENRGFGNRTADSSLSPRRSRRKTAAALLDAPATAIA